MDNRNRITVRLRQETIANWPPACITNWPKLKGDERKIFTQEAAIRLSTATNSYAPGQKISLPISHLLLVTAHDLGLVGDRLEWLRRRLQVRVPASPEDTDLTPVVQGSHDEARNALEKMAEELTKMEALVGVVISPEHGKLFDLFARANSAVNYHFENAHSADPVDFSLALLLIAAGAIPFPCNGCAEDVMERAQTLGLLPQDRMIGLPDYCSQVGAKDIAEIPDIFIRLPLAQIPGFLAFASIFGSENRCANVLLHAHQSGQGVKCAVEYEIRHQSIESLLAGWMSLRGFLDEAIHCQYEKGISAQHLNLMEEFETKAATLESRILPVIHLISGSSWRFSPDFLLALDPLRTETKRLLETIKHTTPHDCCMVELLQTLAII